MYNKKLYNLIITSISKVVKKLINEAFDFGSIKKDKNNIRTYQTLIRKTYYEPVVNLINAIKNLNDTLTTLISYDNDKEKLMVQPSIWCDPKDINKDFIEFDIDENTDIQSLYNFILSIKEDDYDIDYNLLWMFKKNSYIYEKFKEFCHEINRRNMENNNPECFDDIDYEDGRIGAVYWFGEEYSPSILNKMADFINNQYINFIKNTFK